MTNHHASFRDPAIQPFRPGSLSITAEKAGSRQYTKTSHPTRFGTYAEIKTRDFEFHFNLNGQIKFIRGLRPDWPPTLSRRSNALPATTGFTTRWVR